MIVSVATLGAFAAPASAGQANVAPGSVYKGNYNWGVAMADKFRVKTYQSGEGGNFSLRCAGITREKFTIENGKAKLEFGADAVLVKGNLEFRRKGTLEGEMKKIQTDGASCTAPGELVGGLADV